VATESVFSCFNTHLIAIHIYLIVFSERTLYAIARPPVVCLSVVCLSVICNVRAHYSGGSNFQQFFYGVGHPGHPLTCTENFMEIVPWEPLHWGSKTQEG